MHIKILLITILKYNKNHIKKICYYSCILRYYSSQRYKIKTKDDHTRAEQIYDKK